MFTRYAKIVALTVLVALLAGCRSFTASKPVPVSGTAVSPTAASTPVTAEYLVEECVEAMGGIEKIDALETMRTIQNWPDHGLVRYEIKRPNLVKMGDTLVFDGERAAWLTGELVPQAEWKDFEMDIGWYVPAFFDYPAEYLGTEIVDNVETHVLRVTLPLGAVMTYNLDARTYLVYRAISDVTIGDQEYHMERTYSDYRWHDGILYPHAFTYASRDGSEVLTATMETLEFNIPFEDNHFAIPILETTEPTRDACVDFSISLPQVKTDISIQIALPEEYQNFPDKEYVSIYLLDGNYFFGETGILDDMIERGEGMTKIVQNLTREGKIPPTILIGIGYTEAQRMGLMMGDVASFYEFFTAELIPEIESRCRVSRSAQDRVLFGYSASAHFSTYALLYDVSTGVETFGKVISISGVYDKYQAAYKLEESIFQEMGVDAFSGQSLFIAVGDSDPKTQLLAAHRAFTEKLSSRGYTDFRLNSTEFADKGHYDIPEFAFAEGLIWILAK